MNSWQSAGEAHKNKPVVQFLAMVMRLEIITGNWGEPQGQNPAAGTKQGLFLGNRDPFPCSFIRSRTPTWASQVWYPDPGAEDPLSGGIWERCVLLVRFNILTCPSLGRWLMDAFVYSSAGGLFSKGGDCLPLCGISGAAVLRAFRTKPAAEGGCFKGHCCLWFWAAGKWAQTFVCRGIFELGSAQCHRW